MSLTSPGKNILGRAVLCVLSTTHNLKYSPRTFNTLFLKQTIFLMPSGIQGNTIGLQLSIDG